MKTGEIWKTKDCNPSYKVRIIEFVSTAGEDWVAYLIHEDYVENFKEAVLKFAGMTEDFLELVTKKGTIMTRKDFIAIFEKCYE